MKNGMGSEVSDLDFPNYHDLASNSNYNEQFSSTAPKSPHKIVRGHKLRRYDDSKQSVTISSQIGNEGNFTELERQFSPINSQKTFGVRMS